MKLEYSLLTLLSASLVAAVPAPFVVTDPVVATGTEHVAVPVNGLVRRQQVSVYGFRKRTLELRDALLAARGGQRQNQDSDDDQKENAGDAQEQAAEDEQAAGKGKGKGKGNAEGVAAPPAPPVAPNATDSAAGKGRGKGKANQEGDSADQEYTLLGAEQAGGNATGMSPHDLTAASLLIIHSRTTTTTTSSRR